MQRKAGVEVQVLGADELRRCYPSFRFAGVDCGALSLADREIDPHAALMRFCGRWKVSAWPMRMTVLSD